jgi:GT2 family glycosyltransferase
MMPLAPDRSASCTAIVVSYQSAAHLPACLRSLEAQRGAAPEIHVVDNASTDGSAALVRREFPRVHLVENPRNVGFAAANNQILERGGASFFALVNPDTVVPPDAFAACLEHFKRHPAAGIVATRLVNPDGTLQPSCHAFLGLRNLLGETFGVHRALPGLRPLTSLHMPWFAHDQVAEVDWIQGAFVLVRGEVVRAVGGLDTDFFMYGEEMDWCLRIRLAGWKVVFLPRPSVLHVGGVSSRPVAGPMFVENLKGRVRFLLKHRGPRVAAVARGLIALSVLLRFASREIAVRGVAMSGKEPSEALRTSHAMFRAAAGWVRRGLPLSPPGS